MPLRPRRAESVAVPGVGKSDDPVPARMEIVPSWAGVTRPRSGVNDSEATEAAPAPSSFTARSLTVYAVPLVRPEMVSGDHTRAGDSAIHGPEPLSWYS
ncbi:unannotated protein [freshwater metagenome]|uniref:Unannotated protein n=1 Tax=freshwater metagenome TaxID=449393 RepID=A0A6J7KXL3_9ZZZZ